MVRRARANRAKRAFLNTLIYVSLSRPHYTTHYEGLIPLILYYVIYLKNINGQVGGKGTEKWRQRGRCPHRTRPVGAKAFESNSKTAFTALGAGEAILLYLKASRIGIAKSWYKYAASAGELYFCRG